MYISFPVDIDFTIKGKSYRLTITEDGLILYQIFEDEDDKELINFTF